MATIRNAKEGDGPELIVLLKKFLKASDYPLKVDVEFAIENFKRALTHPDFFCAVADDDEAVVGFIIGMINRPMFSRDTAAVELGWWVDKDYRDARTSFKLLDAFEQWAKRMKVRFVSMADIHDLQDLGTLYGKRGYKLKEKTYVKETSWHL